MNSIALPKKPIRRIKVLAVARPKLETDWFKKAELAEPTGMGDTLCIEGYFGRVFRSDRQLVEEILAEQCDMYDRMCERFDKAKENEKEAVMEVLCWNDLYRMLNLIPSIAGDSYGYVNSPDYRVSAMDFDTKWCDQGEWVDCFREPFFYFNPKPFCVPDPCYLEY